MRLFELEVFTAGVLSRHVAPGLGLRLGWGHSLDPEAAAMGETLSLVRSRTLSCWTRRRHVQPAAPVSVVAAWAPHKTETETKTGDRRQRQKHINREGQKQRRRRGQRQRQRHLSALLCLFLSYLSYACAFDCAHVARHTTARPVARRANRASLDDRPLCRRRPSVGPPLFCAAPPHVCSRAFPFASH